MNNFAILRSVDVPAHISQHELAAYTQQVILQVQQTGRLVPPLLIMHISEALAEMVGISKTGVIRHDVTATPELSSYYEIWLIGGAVFADYALALQSVITEIQGLTPLAQATQDSAMEPGCQTKSYCDPVSSSSNGP